MIQKIQPTGTKSKFYYLFSRLLPHSFKNHITAQLRFAGTADDVDAWAGAVVLLGFLFAIVGFLAFWLLLRLTEVQLLLVAALGSFILSFFFEYFLLLAQVEDRRKRLEKVLPDLLQMVASNVRAGMTPIVALRMSARPEFGMLEEEIKVACTKTLGTGSFVQALSEMAIHVNSEVFNRVIALFSSSLKAGGHLATLLENTSQDIHDSQELRQQLISSSRLYVLFVLFVVALGTPLLLSVSSQFVDMVAAIQAKSATDTAATVGLSLATPFSKEFLVNLSYAILAVNSLLAGLLIGAIEDGKPENGLKFFPVLLVISFVAFIVLKDYALKAFLSF